MAKALSSRAELLLGIVREGSDPETGRIWLPRAGAGVDVSGSGDASTLRSLERRGLLTFNKLAPYACIVTYAGIAEYEKILARRKVA